MHKEQPKGKRRFTWNATGSLLVISWFAGFIAFHMVSKWSELRGIVPGECFFGGHWVECSDSHFLLALFLGALSQFLTPINIVLSVAVVCGILGIQSFVAGLRGKHP